MPSSPKIPREQILKSALALLIRDGYSVLNIKVLAKELGSSTQPISWHFGNMEGLRRELAEYALSYADHKMQPCKGNGFEAFTEVGNAYVTIAFDEPNLFRFLFMDGNSSYCMGGPETLSGLSENKEMVQDIAESFGISTEEAAAYIQNTIIYSHGLLTLVVSGVIKSDKKQVMQMIDHAGYAFLLQTGADIRMAKKLPNHLTEGGL